MIVQEMRFCNSYLLTAVANGICLLIAWTNEMIREGARNGALVH
jgi:hypothetical protein